MKALLAVLGSSVIALSSVSADAAETIRAAGNFATEHSSSLAMQRFKEELETLSEGEIEVNVFPAQQLGGAAENVQAVKVGAIELMWVGTAYLTRTVPELEIIGLPFQFDSREQAFSVVDGSFDWADEISRLAFVWAIFLAIPLGIRDKSHVGISLLVIRFPAALRRLTGRLMSLLAAAMMVIVFWSAIHVSAATWSERLGSINITSSVFFFPVIVGAAHAALHLFYQVLYPPEWET